MTLLLFLGFLPLFNAPLDWLSLGVTRALLRRIVAPGHRFWHSMLLGLVDLFLAVLFLVLVAFSTLGGIVLVNAFAHYAGAGPVVSLGDLWLQLSTGRPGDNLWIWLMLGSTLLPTFVHMLVAIMALAMLFSAEQANEVADSLAAELERSRREAGNGAPFSVDEYARRAAFLYLAPMKVIVALVWLFVVGSVSWPLIRWLPDGVKATLDWLNPWLARLSLLWS